MKMTYAQRYGYNCMLRTLKEIIEMNDLKQIKLIAKATVRNKKPIPNP